MSKTVSQFCPQLMSPLKSSKLMWPHPPELKSTSRTRVRWPMKAPTSQVLFTIDIAHFPVAVLTTWKKKVIMNWLNCDVCQIKLSTINQQKRKKSAWAVLSWVSKVIKCSCNMAGPNNAWNLTLMLSGIWPWNFTVLISICVSYVTRSICSRSNRHFACMCIVHILVSSNTTEVLAFIENA